MKRKRARRKNTVDLTNYSNEHCLVLEEIEVNKWKVKCNYCNETHIQSTKSIKNNSRCRSCSEFKPHNYSGLDRWDAIIRRVYGITLKEYDEMLYEQGNGCAICGRQEDVVNRRLAIDHCHESNKVRGILCSRCNQGLGMFDDNIEILQSAIEYLQNFKPDNSSINI